MLFGVPLSAPRALTDGDGCQIDSHLRVDGGDATCPFANLLVFDPSTIQDLPDPLRAAMMTVAQTQRMKGVLALFPSTYQAGCQAKLLASTPDWWKPQELWKEWPIMLKACLPGLFEVTPASIALAQSYAKSPTPKSGSASVSSPPAG